MLNKVFVQHSWNQIEIHVVQSVWSSGEKPVGHSNRYIDLTLCIGVESLRMASGTCAHHVGIYYILLLHNACLFWLHCSIIYQRI